MELVYFLWIFHGIGVLSLIVRGIGGFFVELVDFSWIFRGIAGFFVELVDFPWMFRGIGGFFVDFSWNCWIFRGIGGFFGQGGGTGKDAPRMLSPSGWPSLRSNFVTKN